MPRPRKATDEDIFAAAYRVMQRAGPADFTLAAIAEEAGLTAGLLVQRFGSKHALQVRLAAAAADFGAGMIAQLRAKHRSPLAALRAYAGCFAEMASSPEAFVRNLAYLTEDLSDPKLRVHLERQSRAVRAELESLLRDAIEAGELAKGTDVRQLARTVEAIVPGSMLTWATYREGKADRWMRRELDAVIEPYVA